MADNRKKMSDIAVGLAHERSKQRNRKRDLAAANFYD